MLQILGTHVKQAIYIAPECVWCKKEHLNASNILYDGKVGRRMEKGIVE